MEMAGRFRPITVALGVFCVWGAFNVASASAVLFHSEVEKTFGFGQQVTEGVYTTPAGSMKCKKAQGTGTMIGFTASSIKLALTISECTAFGQAATRSENGCEYRATATGTIDLECPPGKEVSVVVPAGNCSITTPGQTGLAEYKNEGSGTTRRVLVTSKAEKLKYTVHGPGTICGTTGEYSNAKITGTALVKGYADEALTKQVGIWVE
jgi:hypothetical protein